MSSIISGDLLTLNGWLYLRLALSSIFSTILEWEVFVFFLELLGENAFVLFRLFCFFYRFILLMYLSIYLMFLEFGLLGDIGIDLGVLTLALGLLEERKGDLNVFFYCFFCHFPFDGDTLLVLQWFEIFNSSSFIYSSLIFLRFIFSFWILKIFYN